MRFVHIAVFAIALALFAPCTALGDDVHINPLDAQADAALERLPDGRWRISTPQFTLTIPAAKAQAWADQIDPPPPPAPNRCSNGLDDDGDSLVDLGDPGCGGELDDDESNTLSEAPWRWDARNATLDANSEALVAAFQTYAKVNPNLATNRWTVATATAGAGDPTYSIPRTSQGGSLSVRVKLGTKPDPAGDGHLTIRDEAAGVETDFWKAVYDTTTQRISSASSAVSFQLDAVNEQTSGWGGNAANNPLARGLVTPEQIIAGQISETLQFGMPKIGGTQSSFRYPALHNTPTCGTDCANHLSEGTWLRLDPKYDVAASTLPAWQKTVAKALQDHGMILRDNAGSLSIYGKNPVNGGATWTQAGLGTAGSVAFSAAFPWDRLQVLEPPRR